MTAEKVNYIAQTDVVNASGALLQLNVTEKWQVRNGEFVLPYSPEASLCLAALMSYADIPVSGKLFRSEIIDVHETALSHGIAKNPLLEAGKISNVKKNSAMSTLLNNQRSVLKDNIFLLGHGSGKLILFCRNVFDEGYGLKIIDDYLDQYPVEQVRTIYLKEPFLRAFTRRHLLPKTPRHAVNPAILQ